MKTKIELVQWDENKYSIRITRRILFFKPTVRFLDLKSYPEEYYEWKKGHRFFTTECIGSKEKVEKIFDMFSAGGGEGKVIKTKIK